MMQDAVFSVNLLRDLVYYGASQGIDPEQLCAAIRISPEVLTHPDQTVSGEPLQAVWRELEQRTGDRNIGLHVGERFNLSAIGVLGYVLFNCQTVEQVLKKLARYTSLFSQGVTIEISTGEFAVLCDCTIVSHLNNYLLNEPRHPIESTFAALMTAIKTLTGKPLSPHYVWFQHPSPEHLLDHQRIFQAPVLFDQSTNRIAFNKDCLKWNVLTANAALLDAFEIHAETALNQLNQTDTYTHQVTQAIAHQLNGEAPSIETIARQLTISVRQLQRSLQAEGTSYQTLLDQTRKAIALRHLHHSDAAIHDIAFLLGFSEPSAFYRAFKRWTGKTPRDYRQKSMV